MKTIKKAFRFLFLFVYRVSGLQLLVSALESFVLRYRLRVRMVPSSYKLFVLFLGAIIGGSSVFTYLEAPKLIESFATVGNSIVFVNTALAVQKPVEKKIDAIEELSQLIYKRESSNGVKNFSKCEAIGKYNGVGYAIPGDGSYICFDSHDDEMAAVRGWLIAKKAAGYTDEAMLCLYSGYHYEGCKK